MRLYWTLTFILTLSIGISQTGDDFIGVISQSESEPNVAGQVFEYQNNLYLSGDYFDSQINRWTAYLAKLKNNGEIDFISTEVIDTIIGLTQSNKVLIKNDSTFIFGTGVGNKSILSFDLVSQTLGVINKIDFSQVEMSITDIEYNSYTGNTLISGRNTGSNDLKILALNDDEIYYEGPLTSNNSLAKHLKVINEETVVVICQEQYFNNDKIYHNQYLIFLDHELNLIKTTKNDQIEMQPATGFLVDSEENILNSGFLRVEQSEMDVFQSVVVKYNADGELLWFKPIDFNVKNDFGLGTWNGILETAEKDGYILVGAENKNYSNQRDSLISVPSVARIDLDGNVIWKKNYPYRTSFAGVHETFQDVVLTSDNHYFIGGGSYDFAIDFNAPWIESIYLKIDGDGEIVSTVSSDEIAINNKNLNLFPNPSDGLVSIELPPGIKQGKVMLVDQRGITFFSSEINSVQKTIEIDSSPYPKGIYFVKIISASTSDVIYSSRLVLN